VGDRPEISNLKKYLEDVIRWEIQPKMARIV
jgi:hypothetical protein